MERILYAIYDATHQFIEWNENSWKQSFHELHTSCALWWKKLASISEGGGKAVPWRKEFSFAFSLSCLWQQLPPGRSLLRANCTICARNDTCVSVWWEFDGRFTNLPLQYHNLLSADFILQSKISSYSDFIHRRWISLKNRPIKACFFLPKLDAK